MNKRIFTYGQAQAADERAVFCAVQKSARKLVQRVLQQYPEYDVVDLERVLLHSVTLEIARQTMIARIARESVKEE